MGYTGQCACGGVTATIDGEPVAVRQCWCRQCRQIAAGSPTTNAMFAAADVTIAGELARYEYVAASGNLLTQSFCPGCGTPVMAQSSARPQIRTLRVGFLDEPNDIAPQMAIWLEDAPGWACIDAKLEQHAGQPPAPTR